MPTLSIIQLVNPFELELKIMTCFLVEPIQRTFEPKRKTKFSKPIIGLVEFVYEEERIECKKISVGEVDSEKKYMRKVMVILYHSFIIYEKKKIRKKLLMKKLCINKGMWKREWMMNGENEMKRKEGWKRYNVMWRKERIGGWGSKWKICTPLVKWFCIKPYSFLLLNSLTL